MLSFTPSEEQTMLVDAINKYVVNDVRKIAHEADESSSLPAEILRKGWEIGLLPAAIPEQYGGSCAASARAKSGAGGRTAYTEPPAPAGGVWPGGGGVSAGFIGRQED